MRSPENNDAAANLRRDLCSVTHPRASTQKWIKPRGWQKLSRKLNKANTRT
jgi:hypothetical protein